MTMTFLDFCWLGSFNTSRLLAERLSEEAASAITNAKIAVTFSHYESVYGIRDSYCNKQSLDSILCNVNPVLKFLTKNVSFGVRI